MAVSVSLEFIPPDEPDLLALHIFEAPDMAGPFTEIDNTQAIGTFPNYITRYTTANATSIYDWFAIAWENTANVLGDLSAPLQGGSTTLVSELVNRVLLRDPNLNPIIVGQEAEAAISEYFGVLDPYTVDLSTVSPTVMSGLTYFTMARSYISHVAQVTVAGSSAGGKWVAGIVQLDNTAMLTSRTNAWDSIEKMMALANKELGRNYSTVLLMKEIQTTSRAYSRLYGIDLTRSEIDLLVVP